MGFFLITKGFIYDEIGMIAKGYRMRDNEDHIPDISTFDIMGFLDR